MVKEFILQHDHADMVQISVAQATRVWLIL